MLDTLLTKLGLSPKASKVYLTCLQLGQASMTEIAKAAGIKRPSTYLIVDELLMRGFLSASKKGRRTTYLPEHPRRFLQILKTSERELEKLLPDLEALYYEPRERPRIRVYEGKEAMLELYREMFGHIEEKGGELLFLTAIGDLEQHFPEAIQEFYKLIQKGNFRLRELDVGDERGRAYARKILRIAGKRHQVRLLDPAVFSFSHTDNLIYGDTLIMFSIRREIFAVVIEHKHIAQTYRSLFNAAWAAGKEP